MVKLHEKRMLDMKKTFQRELRSQVEAGGCDLVNGGGGEDTKSAVSRSPTPSQQLSFAAARLSPVPPSEPSSSSSSAAVLPTADHPHLVTMSEVNFKYLKHVIFKFFTSPDTEVQ